MSVKTKRILTVTAAFFIALVVFLTGWIAGGVTSGKNRKTLEWIKDMVQGYYLYEVTDEQYFAAMQSGLDRYYSKEKDNLLEAALLGLNEYVFDAYSGYLSASEFRQRVREMQGSQSGIGIGFWPTEQGTRISVVSGNSPAETAGLRAGEFVVSVGTADSQTNVYTYRELFAEMSKLGGEYVIYTADEQPEPGKEPESVRKYTLKAEAFENSYVKYRTSTSAYSFRGANLNFIPFGEQLNCSPEIGYIGFSEFNGQAVRQFTTAMNQFKADNKKTLVLDLRNNGGGDMEILCQIAAFFMPSAGTSLLGTCNYRDGNVWKYYSTNSRYAEYMNGVELYVLANSHSASASEALIGALLDYGALDSDHLYISEIGGVMRTYGKGIMQTTYRNNRTSEAIILTSAQLYWPVSGKTVQGVGITDGIPVPASSYVTRNDEELSLFFEMIA